MKKQSLSTRVAAATATFGICAGLLALGTTRLSASTLDVGGATKGGVDFVWIHDGAGWHLIPVDITLPADANPRVKAVTIADAIQKAGFGASPTAGGNVDIAKGGPGGVDKWEYHSNSGENDQAKVALVQIGEPQYFAMGFEGSLSGIAIAGSVASYDVTLGFNGITASSHVLFSALADTSVDNLLATTYANLSSALPMIYQSSLGLDTFTGQITFNLPTGATNAFVAAQSLDTTTGSFIGGNASTVPEPGGLVLFSLGIGAIVAGSWRRSLWRGDRAGRT